MANARLLVVDDHPVIREGMAELIGQYDGLRVAGRAASAEEGLRLARDQAFDLALVDLALDGLSGLDLIKRITAEQEELPVLVLSMQDESLYAERAIGAGARGYVSKEEPIPTVIEAIRTVLGGEVYLSKAIAGPMQLSPEEESREEGSGSANTPARRLSDRELEVFYLLGEGNGTREAASHLNLSIKTIESHRASIKKKLDLKDGTALMQRAALWVQRTKAK